MRRSLIVLGLSAFLLANASSVLADTSPLPDESGTYHFRSSGSSAAASFSNVPSDTEVLPPGTYFSTDIWASDSISTQGGDVFQDSGVCVFHWTFTITDSGDWVDGPSIDGCVSEADLTVSRRTGRGRHRGRRSGQPMPGLRQGHRRLPRLRRPRHGDGRSRPQRRRADCPIPRRQFWGERRILPIHLPLVRLGAPGHCQRIRRPRRTRWVDRGSHRRRGRRRIPFAVARRFHRRLHLVRPTVIRH